MSSQFDYITRMHFLCNRLRAPEVWLPDYEPKKMENHTYKLCGFGKTQCAYDELHKREPFKGELPEWKLHCVDSTLRIKARRCKIYSTRVKYDPELEMCFYRKNDFKGSRPVSLEEII